MHDGNCMIPRQVTTRSEFFPGFGLRELLVGVVGAGVAWLFYKLTGLLSAAILLPRTLFLFLNYALPLIFPIVAIGVVLNGENSLLNLQLRAIRFNRRRRRLFFRIGSADSPTGGVSPVRSLPVPPILWSLAALFTGKRPPTPAQRSLPQTVQQWLPVRDLRSGGLMVRRDGALVAGIRMEPRNISLLSDGERRRLLKGVQAALNPIAGSALQVLSLPRPIDLDGYLRRLDERVSDLAPPRQRLLRQYIRHVGGLVAGGDAQERRFYVLLSRLDAKHAAEELRQQVADLAVRMQQAELQAHVVDERELISVLYTFHHPAQAAFERPSLVPHVTTLAKEAP